MGGVKIRHNLERTWRVETKKNFAVPFQVPLVLNGVHRAGFGKYDGPESTLTVEVGRRQCADEQWWHG